MKSRKRHVSSYYLIHWLNNSKAGISSNEETMSYGGLLVA